MEFWDTETVINFLGILLVSGIIFLLLMVEHFCGGSEQASEKVTPGIS